MAQSTDILTVSALRQSGPTRFAVEPDAPVRAELAAGLGALAIKKLRLKGEITPKGRDSWVLKAQLGVTVVQACVVTLDPVTTRLDTDINRTFIPPDKFETEFSTDTETTESEMPEDDTLEALGPQIDLFAVLSESLALAMPVYPRKADAELGQSTFAQDGVTPLGDNDVKPFAGLAALREKLGDNEGES